MLKFVGINEINEISRRYVLSKRVDTTLVKSFGARIQEICCNWAASSSIEQVSTDKTGFSFSLCLLPVTCFSIIQPGSILGTFAKCAAEVCNIACSHHTGNDSASYQVH